ncbi:Hypothetical predicted protein, partial [Marmota monax]
EFPSGYLHWTPDRDVREHQARTRLPFEMLVYSHTTQSNTLGGWHTTARSYSQ